MEPADITPFTHGEVDVRTTTIDGETWFFFDDICKVFGVGLHDSFIEHLDEDERKTHTVKGYGVGVSLPVINLAGLLSVAALSRAPKAKALMRWITHEVLPSIRKHSFYATEKTVDAILENPDEAIEVLTKIRDERLMQSEINGEASHTKSRWWR